MLKELWSEEWNKLSIEQQLKYRCINDFVIERCKRLAPIHEVPANEVDEIVVYIDKHDTKSYERWVIEQRNLGNR